VPDSSADIIVVGTGVVGCLIAELLLDAGHSVLMLEAGPRVARWQIVENFRNLSPSARGDPDAPYPPAPWAPHPVWTGDTKEASYLQVEGPNARAYQQDYIRYAGGSTWHWAGTCWRMTPEDLALKSRFGVGRDWPFGYDVLEPYYTRAEYAMGVCGPSDPALQWPGIRSKPYPMGPLPLSPGEQRFTEAAARAGYANLPAAQARNSGVSYHDRPACCGNNSCIPVCPIGAKYDAASSLTRIEGKGGKIIENAVVHRVVTGPNDLVEAVHYLDPSRQSHRVTGSLFVVACNAIESPKILLMSKNDRNPRGVANSSDQVGRNMMDQPKLVADLELAEPAWTGVGPIQGSSIIETSQGTFRDKHAGAQFRFNNMARSRVAAIAALEAGFVGKALDLEIRRRAACTAQVLIEHETLANPVNRLTLSAKRDWLGLPKPNVYYDVGDYTRLSAASYTKPIARQLADAMGATKLTVSTEFTQSTHMMGSMIMGRDPSNSVVDPDCRAHDHTNLFLPGGGAMPSGASGNSTLTMAALALKAADAIIRQLSHASPA
jgi:choline dehydrogenase-like flavoprotein